MPCEVSESFNVTRLFASLVIICKYARFSGCRPLIVPALSVRLSNSTGGDATGRAALPAYSKPSNLSLLAFTADEDGQDGDAFNEPSEAVNESDAQEVSGPSEEESLGEQLAELTVTDRPQTVAQS
jgi:hypothetical protein